MVLEVVPTHINLLYIDDRNTAHYLLINDCDAFIQDIEHDTTSQCLIAVNVCMVLPIKQIPAITLLDANKVSMKLLKFQNLGILNLKLNTNNKEAICFVF